MKVDGHLVEVLGIGVGIAASASTCNISNMFLHAFLEILLGTANIGFSSCVAFNAVDYNLFSTVVVVVASFGFLVATIAVLGLKVFGNDIFVDLGHDIAIKKLM